MRFDTADSAVAEEMDVPVVVKPQLHWRLDLPAEWARRLEHEYVQGYTRALIDIRALAKLTEEGARG